MSSTISTRTCVREASDIAASGLQALTLELDAEGDGVLAMTRRVGDAGNWSDGAAVTAGRLEMLTSRVTV